MKNVAKEVQGRIDALIEKRNSENKKIRAKLEELRAELEGIQSRAKAAAEALDTEAYMKEQADSVNVTALISMYEYRLKQINSDEIVSEEDSEKTVNDLLSYARNLDEHALKKMEPHIEALRAIEKEYTDSLIESQEVLRRWADSIRPRRYPADPKGERLVISVNTYVPCVGDNIVLLRSFLERVGDYNEGK